MRKSFLDNIRYIIVLSVIFYHVFYMFNSVGVITNITTTGIPQFDIVLYILYPWFMICLFLIAGISARYALQKQTDKEFLKKRCRRLLVPSICGIFILGWVSGFVTNQYVDMFAGNGDLIPLPIKLLIYCISGIGPLWFLHELMLASLILVILRKIDKRDRLHTLGGKADMPVMLLLTFAVWGSAQILNTPVMEIYRNGIYIFVFLLGYYVFSHDGVQEKLAKMALPLLLASVILCVIYCITYWGENYSSMDNLKSLLTNAYAWLATLAILGCGKRFLEKETGFTRYMRGNSFGFYVLHYPIMVIIAYIADYHLHMPTLMLYVITLVGTALLLPIITAVIKRIPVIRTLLLGL